MALLFTDMVLPLINGLFDGYNATVLAYGQVRLNTVVNASVLSTVYGVFSNMLLHS